MNIIYIIILIYLNRCVSKKEYYNYTLYRAIPLKIEDVEFLLEIGDVYNANYWMYPSLVKKPVEFLIPPDMKKQFLVNAEKQNIYLSTLIEDIQSSFDLQTVKTYIRRNMESFDWTNYFRLDDIYEWLRDLSDTYEDVMQLQSIGRTFEKREILAVRINKGEMTTKPKVIVEGGIHAREWISMAFVTYFLHRILTANENIALKHIAESYEWFFVPVLNPDGYEYSHLKDRLYRKNTRGVDINRNFDIKFGTVGVSFSKNSDVYCGPSAFSEAESSAMEKFVRKNKQNLQYYLAFHSYGQYMIIPYAYSAKHQDNFDEVYNMSRRAAKRITKKYGTKYSVGTAYDTVGLRKGLAHPKFYHTGYLTSGVSGCWAKKEFKVPYVLTFELRDDGKHGFALPPDQILPTCRETMEGIIQLLTNNQLLIKHNKENKVPKEESNGGTILNSLKILWNFCLFILVRFY